MIANNTKIAVQTIGGGSADKRSETDFYPTPSEVTDALLRCLDLPKTNVIWEPACGELDMVLAMERAGYSVIATDISRGQDFLEEPLPECDWIITNPPFSVSDKFIRRCAEHGKPFALLLKSQYWHAAKRAALFSEIMPTYVLPLTWRPDFLFKKHEKRSAPLMDVMWCVWVPPYNHRTVFFPLSKQEGVLR